MYTMEASQACALPFEVEESRRAFIDLEGNFKFYPPLYRQRYEAVKEILSNERWSPPLATVVEFGCAELAMFPYFKRVPNITKVIMVDIDFDILEWNACRAAPLTADYLCPRTTPLRVEVLCGSVADCDIRLLGANAVVCIELIEHLELEVVDQLEETIFRHVMPEIAIFTTPNSDFNVLIPGMLPGKFRHYDHKFEWSRKEFLDWTNKVISKFPEYQVEISGVGAPLAGQDHVGHCSQLALFSRTSAVINDTKLQANFEEIYRVCRTYDHPVKAPDLRSDKEKLSDEVTYHLNRIGKHHDYYADDDDCFYVPLDALTQIVKTKIPSADMASVRCLLSPDELVEKDGQFYVNFDIYSSKFRVDSDIEEDNDWINEEFQESCEDHLDQNVVVQEEETWEEDNPNPPLTFAEYHTALATFDNATNLVWERQTQYTLHNFQFMDSDDNEDDADDSEEDDFCWPTQEKDMRNELKDISPCSSKLIEESSSTTLSRVKEFPKSTSVEVLHLDGSSTLGRCPGLELIEFAPSTSVKLCYTGQSYCDSFKTPSRDNMMLSSERKSLDSSLVKDVADSYSLDFAVDSGYPNSSLHHDVDVDLTPEQVDDISSENDDQSNQSLSEDELSESSGKAPALPRRVILPRHPVVPIVFENVENGDLANNNQDGEGNNAIAPPVDEREFVALVQEDDLQPLLAAPIVDDVILPNNADLFPDWLMNLLRPECENVCNSVEKIGEEIECDEGLGNDSI